MEVMALKKAMQILQLLQGEGEMGVREIAKALDINKSTVHRLLVTLKNGGYIQQNEDNDKYWLGLELYSLGETVKEKLTLRTFAEPRLRKLGNEINEYIHMAIIDEVEQRLPHIFIIARIHSGQHLALSPHLGPRTPCNCSAMGKCLLAYKGVEYINSFRHEPLPGLTDFSITEWDALEEECRHIRTQGYSTEIGEIEVGLACIAFPIFDRKGQIIASFSVSGPEGRIAMKREQIVKEMERTSKELSYIY